MAAAPAATTEICTGTSRIKAIDAASVHRICSGQVVLDLASAVKELVENALDAGATVVRLKEHGSELVEVADNGSGVPPSDFAALTAKYHTSKLHAFTDLTSLTTFGFRGEALSSLCALSELSVVTRTATEEAGTRLEFDSLGRLKSQATAARAPGTTVILKDLFKPLAVRHKEFLRNLKREYGKLLALLQAYALICRGARLVVTHASGRGPRTTVLHTQGSTSLRDNIITVLGAKALASMQPLEADLRCEQCTVTGFLSQPSAGSGRATGDRQFLSVNGRPVDLPRMVRTLNEVYHTFNAQQMPAAVLDFRLPTSSYDINITPDKRRIMLHAEDALVAAFSDALLAAWAPSREIFAVGGAAVTQNSNKRKRDGTLRAAQVDGDSEAAWDSKDDDASGDEDTDLDRGKCDAAEETDVSEQHEPSAPPADAQAVPRARLAAYSGQIDGQQAPMPAPAAETRDKGVCSGGARPVTRAPPQPSLFQATIAQFAAPSITCAAERVKRAVPPTPPGSSDRDDDAHAQVHDANIVAAAAVSQPEPTPVPALPQVTNRGKAALAFDLATVRMARDARTRAAFESANMETRRQRFSASSLRSTSSLATGAESELSSSAADTDADADAAATAELERVFNRANFASLRVVGQFNLGFILATLQGDDLFIIDQHASDEIFNFERLQRTTQLTRQPLLVPQSLELSPAEAQTVLHHMDMFRANGFDIDEVHDGKNDADDEVLVVPRLRLIAVPVSKNVTFDSGDVHELVALLDGRAPTARTPAGPFGTIENGIIRPAKVRSMLAMRACRSSIMIGRALDKPQMARVLANLTTLKAPWNCPHGRPTMRHLVSDLKSLAGKFADD